MAIKPTKKIFGPDEALGQGMTELFKTAPKKAMLLSDLDDEEILNLSLLLTWADLIDSEAMKSFCENFLRLRVSRFRLGRREIVAIASYSSQPERKKIKNIKDLFAGIR